MTKDSFIIYTSFYNPISKLSDKQLGRLFRAIFRYNLGEVVNVEEDIEMAFSFFVNQFKIDEAKYQSRIKRDIENGRKGGNPNFKRGQRNPYYPKEKYNDNPGLEKITQDNPRLSKITQDKAINDNVNDNDIIEELDKSNSMSEIEISDLPDGGDDEEDCKISVKHSGINYTNLRDFFNQQMEKENATISHIRNLTDKRKRAVNARCREHGKEAIYTVIVNASKSDFLNGKNSRNWIAGFDWLFLPNNFTKVLEGNYNNTINNHDTDIHKLGANSGGANNGLPVKGKFAPEFGLIEN